MSNSDTTNMAAVAISMFCRIFGQTAMLVVVDESRVEHSHFKFRVFIRDFSSFQHHLTFTDGRAHVFLDKLRAK